MRSITRHFSYFLSWCLITTPVLAQPPLLRAQLAADVNSSQALAALSQASLDRIESHVMTTYEQPTAPLGSSLLQQTQASRTCKVVTRIGIERGTDLSNIQYAIGASNGSLREYLDPTQNLRLHGSSLIESVNGHISIDPLKRVVTFDNVFRIGCSDFQLANSSPTAFKTLYAASPDMIVMATTSQIQKAFQTGGVVLGIAIAAGLLYAVAAPSATMASLISAGGACIGSAIATVSYDVYAGTGSPKTTAADAVFSCVKSAIPTGLAAGAVAKALASIAGRVSTVAIEGALDAGAPGVNLASLATEQTISNEMATAAGSAATSNGAVQLARIVQAVDDGATATVGSTKLATGRWVAHVTDTAVEVTLDGAEAGIDHAWGIGAQDIVTRSATW